MLTRRLRHHGTRPAHALAGLILLGLTSACADSNSGPVGRADPAVDLGIDEERLADERLEELSALGYAGHVREERRAEESGLTIDQPEGSFRGLTIFGARHESTESYLFDAEGRELHRWSPTPARGTSLLWMEPTADGNLLALGRRYLVKMDWNAGLLWQADRRNYHHDFSQDESGRIHALAGRRRVVPFHGQPHPIVDDYVAILSPEGTTLTELSMYDLFGLERIPEGMDQVLARSRAGETRSTMQPALDALGLDNPHDLYHLNSVQVIDRDIGVAGRGDLLLCARSLDLVFAVDPERGELVWEWSSGTDQLDRPHAPRLLENDNLLIFDNGWRRGHSRVIELDPRSGEIVWEYTADPPEAFFTQKGGMAQPLPGGNVLITESDTGRLFEVTRAGDIVWEFLNPRFEINSDGSKAARQTIYRAWRWSPEVVSRLELPAEVRAELVSGGYSRSASEQR